MSCIQDPGIPGIQSEEENSRQKSHEPRAVAQAEEEGDQNEDGKEDIGEKGIPEEEGQYGRS